MIAVIRISGLVGVRKEIEETFSRLRLRKKYSCVLLQEKPEILGMLEKVKHHVAYGKIDDETLKLLLEKRGRINKKNLPREKVQEVFSGLMKGKSIKELGIKPFFRLHPPIGGFKKSTKLLFPKGILGKHENINLLLKKML